MLMSERPSMTKNVPRDRTAAAREMPQRFLLFYIIFINQDPGSVDQAFFSKADYSYASTWQQKFIVKFGPTRSKSSKI